jgi:drug/metabolite transporter (DMT)-like permease
LLDRGEKTVSVPAAFIAVVLIWSTTPLALKWSGEGPGFIFGAFGRMAFAAALCLLLINALRIKLPWHREARNTYLSATLGIYGAMICVYWGAQYISSGLIAVLFGLTPMVTALLARVWLKEQSLTPEKIAGMIFGVLGLLLIFGDRALFGSLEGKGIAVVLLGVFLHAASIVWVKRTNTSLPGIAVTSGGLLFAVPLYFITWLIIDGAPPESLNDRALFSIIYLGVIGSVVGFTLFYYVLKHMEANGVVLITLITPVLALVLGNTINNELIGMNVLSGALLVLSGLAIHQWGGLLYQKLFGRVSLGER